MKTVQWELLHCIDSLRMRGAKAGGSCGSGTVGAMGTKEKLLLLKLRGHVTWGQKFAWPQCASVVSLPLLAPAYSGPSSQQRPLEVSNPSPCLKSLEMACRGGGIPTCILTGYRAQSLRASIGTTPELILPLKVPEPAAAGPRFLPG